MHVRVCVDVCKIACACVRACICVWVCAHMRLHMRLRGCLCASVCTCMCACMHKRMPLCAVCRCGVHDDGVVQCRLYRSLSAEPRKKLNLLTTLYVWARRSRSRSAGLAPCPWGLGLVRLYGFINMVRTCVTYGVRNAEEVSRAKREAVGRTGLVCGDFFKVSAQRLLQWAQDLF